MDESDIHALFERWPRVRRISVARDRFTGLPRGFAHVEFEDVGAARGILEAEGGAVDAGGGVRLRLDFGTLPTGGGGGGGGLGVEAHDWVCTRCQATNFARRLECHQCSSARQADAPRVAAEGEGPSRVLKVSNLEPHITSEALRQHLSRAAPVRAVALVSDRLTGAPRGFAFAHFATVADASKALHALQESYVKGQARPLRLMFGRDKHAPPQATSAAAANALEAAQSMAAYASWAPKEFDEQAVDAAAAAAAAAAPGSNGQAGEAAGTSGSDAGFQYDSASGYHYHAASGYYYDANSGLYYDSSDQQWKRLDTATGRYLPVSETTAAAAGPMQAPEVAAYKPPAASSRKRGAVIGSAAQLDPEALEAAAREAKAKEAYAAQMARQKQRAAGGKKGKVPAKAAAQAAQAPAAAAAAAAAAAPGQPAAAAAAGGGAVKGVIRSSGKWGGPRPAL